MKTSAKPFFVANLDFLDTLVHRWFDNFPRVQPYYAVNCNSDPVFLAALAKYPGFGFKCTTKSNVNSVTNHSNSILFSSPSWTRGTLNFAMENNINFISFDNARDLRRISDHNPHVNLLLNISINANNEDPSSEFGCSIEESPELLRVVSDLGLSCVGIGFHIGKGDMNARTFDKAIDYASQLFDFGRQLGHDMKILNLGGGFESDSAFETLACHINRSLEDYFSMMDVQVIAAPGRFFASSVFSLVTSITEKVAIDASHLTNDDFDLGKEAFVYHTNKGYYGPFGCMNMNTFPKCNPLFNNDDMNKDIDQFFTSVRGPTTDSFDIIQSQCQLKQLYVGDWLIWLDMGAYSLQNNTSLDDGFKEELPIYYINNESMWENNSCIGIETSSDNDSVISDDSMANLSDLFDDEEDDQSQSIWSNWMAVFGRERASNYFTF